MWDLTSRSWWREESAWFGDMANWAQFIVLFATATFVVLQLREGRRLRREQARPYVAVQLAFRRNLALIEIVNLGPTMGYEVQLAFDDEPTSRTFAHVAEKLPIKDPIPNLAPNQSLRFNYENMLGQPSPWPRLSGTVTYRGNKYGPRFRRRRETLVDHFDLWLQSFEGSAMAPDHMADLVKHMRQISEELKRLGSASEADGRLVTSREHSRNVLGEGAARAYSRAGFQGVGRFTAEHVRRSFWRLSGPAGWRAERDQLD